MNDPHNMSFEELVKSMIQAEQQVQDCKYELVKRIVDDGNLSREYMKVDWSSLRHRFGQ
jgi:hypothetical protein